MDLNQFKKNICRICLEDNVYLDWNTSLHKFHDTTYKDCYYKYSQLESYDPDPFPQMLCKSCSNALYSTHVLILQALESHQILQNELSSYDLLEETSTNSEYETVLVEMIEDRAVEDFEYDECSDGEIIVVPNVSKEQDQTMDLKVAKTEVKDEADKFLKMSTNNFLERNASPTNEEEFLPRGKRKKTVLNKKNNTILENQSTVEEKIMERKVIEFDDDDEDEANVKVESAKVKPKVKKINKEKPTMCSICSKILHSKYSAIRHEKTHMENRERKETCKICGVKLYDKRGLYSHMLIHKENREKKHKCEYCSKSFYNKGGLNVHRRIHLGLMVPCNLCDKQFFRQVDLDIHMNSHSATTINSETKKRSRYFVRCKYCGKSILTTSFKSHTAAHLNEPLMKCTICDKEYFSRGSCVIHVKKVHHKSNEEYNDFISIFKKNRVSHLFLEQKADIHPDID